MSDSAFCPVAPVSDERSLPADVGKEPIASLLTSDLWKEANMGKNETKRSGSSPLTQTYVSRLRGRITCARESTHLQTASSLVLENSVQSALRSLMADYVGLDGEIAGWGGQGA